MIHNFRERALSSVKAALPSTLKTCIWVVEITVGVSFLILLLRYFNILPWISSALEPLFRIVGLPGEASLAYVSGFFVNVYSAIAIAVTLDLDPRAMTILAVMVLCSHNMIVETAVQKKTGTSALRIVLTRTLSGIALALLLNWIMPRGAIIEEQGVALLEHPGFWEMLKEWALSTIMLVLKMVLIIFSLNILQKLLAEFGVIRWISKFLRPLLKVFGLPAKSSFLWIIANVVGLAYGAAAMIDEVHAGKLSKEDVNKTNIHICISHSNIEDLLLFTAVGGIWWIILVSRWIASLVLVWGYRFEIMIRNKFVPLQPNMSDDERRES